MSEPNASDDDLYRLAREHGLPVPPRDVWSAVTGADGSVEWRDGTGHAPVFDYASALANLPARPECLTDGRVRCPECVAAGLRSCVRADHHEAARAAVPDVGAGEFYDEDGVRHSHYATPVVVAYECSAGHRWRGLPRVDVYDCEHPGCSWPDDRRREAAL